MTPSPKQLAEFIIVLSREPMHEARFRSMGEKPGTQGLADLKEICLGYLSMSDRWTMEEAERFESELKHRGLPSIVAMSSMLKKSHLKILKRGRIRNDNEFYLIRALLANVDFPLSPEEKILLARMEHDYEYPPNKPFNELGLGPTEPA